MKWFLVAAAAALIVAVGARSVASWRNFGDLNHNAPGTWLGMAADARDGAVYRPMVSDIGYGGTRYGPVFPEIIAGLMAAGCEPVTSGFIAGIFAAIVAISGLFALMRVLRAEAAVAAPMAVFLIAATTTHSIILGIRCDLLPLGLSLWGMAAVVWASETKDRAKMRWRLTAAGLCFALALACKITSVFGIGAAVIWLLLRKQPRFVVGLCVASAVSVAIFAVIIEVASHGRAGEILAISASGGGGLLRLIRGPLLLLEDIVEHDHTLALFWGMAIVLLFAANLWGSLPAIFLLISSIGTAAIYGSPGTHSNHLVDVTAASLLVLAVPVVHSRALQQAFTGISVLLVLAAGGFCLRQVGQIDREGVKRHMNAALADADQSWVKGPILSEAPLLPILRGERPYMLDPFIFRAVREKDPGIAGQLWSDLDRRRFAAVILHGPADNPRFESNEDDFGKGFIERMEQTYTLKSVNGDFYVFLPKR